ncbi:MAG TPA: prephenate dehydrogenase/arogenate dehydrogenase family protein [Opitutaceae bacterium]
MIETLAILAPGLLGGSVAMAAHARGVAKRIVIWARRPETRLALQGQPWCNEVLDTPEAAVAKADFVVLAAPVEKIIELAEKVGPKLASGAVMTDVGSVKAELTRRCSATVSSLAAFVGSHPMAGSQKTGWENGHAQLFENRVTFVTPLEKTPAWAVEKVVRFWNDLGSETTTVSADEHDEIVAHISHLPQAIATSLCTFLAQKNPAWRNFAGGGLRDTTRIAGSDAAMWIEIFQQNRDEVLRALGNFQDELQALRSAISNREWTEVRARLERGKSYREAFRP